MDKDKIEYVVTNHLVKSVNLNIIKNEIDKWDLKIIPHDINNKVTTYIFTKNEEWRYDEL